MARLDKKTKDEGRTNFDDILPRCGSAAVSRFVLFFFFIWAFFEICYFDFKQPATTTTTAKEGEKMKMVVKNFLLFYAHSLTFFHLLCCCCWDFCLILSRFGLSMSIGVVFRQQLSLSLFFLALVFQCAFGNCQHLLVNFLVSISQIMEGCHESHDDGQKTKLKRLLSDVFDLFPRAEEFHVI